MIFHSYVAVYQRVRYILKEAMWSLVNALVYRTQRTKMGVIMLIVSRYAKNICRRLLYIWLVVSTPLKNIKVSWDDEIPNRWKNNPNVPNHQADQYPRHIPWKIAIGGVFKTPKQCASFHKFNTARLTLPSVDGSPRGWIIKQAHTRPGKHSQFAMKNHQF